MPRKESGERSAPFAKGELMARIEPLYHAGKTPQEIAEALKVERDKIYRSIKNGRRSGRFGPLSEDQKSAVAKARLENPSSGFTGKTHSQEFIDKQRQRFTGRNLRKEAEERRLAQERIQLFIDRASVIPGILGRPTLSDLYEKAKRPFNQNTENTNFLVVFYAARIIRGVQKDTSPADVPYISLEEFGEAFEVKDPMAFERLSEEIRFIAKTTEIANKNSRVTMLIPEGGGVVEIG